MIVAPTANDPENLKNISYNNTLEITTGFQGNGTRQQPRKTTTLDECSSSRGQQHSGVAALNKKEKNETKQGGKMRRRIGCHFPFAVRLLGTSSRSVPLTGEV